MLTKRQREILTVMRDTEEELVYERGQGYVGDSPVAARTVFALFRLCAVRNVSDTKGGLERYVINETGTRLLQGDVSALDPLRAAVALNRKHKKTLK